MITPADQVLLDAIMAETDPAKYTVLIYEYYEDTKRCARTSPDWLYYHMGMLTTAVFHYRRLAMREGIGN